MLVGIKYCGGCNSGYDRVRFVKHLKERLPEIDFCSIEKHKRVDYMIVVCGCPKVCANTEGIYSRYGYTTIHSLAVKNEVVRAITETAEKYENEKNNKKRMEIGQNFRSEKTMTEAVGILFSELNEDYNKIYTDNDFAEKAGLPCKLIPGRLVSGYISGVMGTVFPGDGAILAEEKAAYRENVFIGDTVRFEIRIVACEEKTDFYIGTFKAECVNQHKHPILEYEAKLKMPKKLFEIVRDGL